MPGETTCPTCGLEAPPGTEYCPRDGTELPGGDATVRRDSLAGAKLGDYIVKQRIGAGGMGIVYEGLQPMIGKRVAIKVLRMEFAEDPVQVQRLLAEARAVNAIRHRGIIDIFGFGEVPDGRQYIVMEYLSGRPLDTVLHERGSIPHVETIPILDEVLSALVAAHGAGVIHRDLKPSNIFIVEQPDGSHYVKLLDFGLAKSTLGSSGNTRVTQVVGTPEYMAPEQARGEKMGAWTDLYALGVVAFELLTGRLPFDGGSAVEIAMKHIEEPPVAPSTLDRSIPPELDKLILRLLAKDPQDRPASAEVVRSEMKRILRSLLSAATRIHEAPNLSKPAPAKSARAPATPAAAEAPEVTAPMAPAPARSPPAARARAVPASKEASHTAPARPARAAMPRWPLAAALGLLCVAGGAALWRITRGAPIRAPHEPPPVLLEETRTEETRPRDPPPPALGTHLAEVTEPPAPPPAPVVAAPLPPPPPVAPEPPPAMDPNAPVRLEPVDEHKAKTHKKGATPVSAFALAEQNAAMRPPTPVPTHKELSQRMYQDSAKLRRLGLDDDTAENAQSLLDRFEKELGHARDADQLRNVARSLDDWEQRYFHR